MTADELRAADEAVAVALGWIVTATSDQGLTCWYCSRGGGQQRRYCPPYVSGGDWRLWGEMWGALPRDGTQTWTLAECWPTKRCPACGAREYDQAGQRQYTVFPSNVVSTLFLSKRADTLGEALYLAGASAGLWPDVREKGDQ